MSLREAILIVTIDVEEDNWGIYRSELTVENVREINRLQVLFDRYGIKPTYLLSYQVALCDRAVNIFAEILGRGKCEIGAHLHPWNRPPLRESLSAKNRMLLNLPYELQAEKLTILSDQKGFWYKTPMLQGRTVGPRFRDCSSSCCLRLSD
jgi:hypothetical protein